MKCDFLCIWWKARRKKMNSSTGKSKCTFSSFAFVLVEWSLPNIMIPGIPLLWTILLPPLWGIPAWDGTGLHGISSVHGGWGWGPELQLQLGGGGQRTEAHMGGDTKEHPGQPPEGPGQPWWSHNPAKHGPVLLWRRPEGAEAEGHRPDLEGAAE